MSLGLAKDSFLNLAELAAGERSNSLEVSGESNEELVMQVDTHQVSFDRESFAAERPLGEYARDSLGQFTAEDDSKDLAELERLVRAHEDKLAEENAGGEAVLAGEGDDNSLSRQSSVGSADAVAAAISAEEESSSYGKYAGFDSDYPEYDELYTDPASYTSYAFKRSSAITMNDDLRFGGGGKQQGQGFWCCLFPWINIGSPAAIQDGNSDEPLKNHGDAETNKDGPLNKIPSRDDDEVSTASDVFGEKLSEKDRQAVLARLRLAQPDSAAATASGETKDSESTDEAANKEKEKGLLNGIVQQPKSLKSILRRPSTMSNPRLNRMNNKLPQQVNGGKQKERRSLFPAYDAPTKPKKNLHVDFADMARVMTVKSHKDMDEDEKGDIWWQRSDYEEFRKTGRMIVRAMLEGGSEIWLASNQSWRTPDQGKTATLKNALSLSEQRKAFERGDINAKEKYERARDKWWHKFGHSRRGLEHIASIDEGRQRQANVRIAIKAVIDEQRRQKAFKRGDPEKLRMVSIQHTSWARDLSIASGASDADVLRQNFNDNSRKSREFFLLKLSRSNKQSDSSKVMPAFMRPAMTFSISPKPNRLDANTVSQVRYRQTQIKKNTATASPRPATSEKPSTTVSEDATTKASMAKQAAGYASGNEALNMSAVLTGMGAMKTPATVGGP